ncbi:unnamed protein product [Phytophthora fragariaefolia]|uniref:Unnamed protein product n=1 Tax=Phytophthora fragariaefolia TaxID=1490495 RepID=A0A9W6XS57_9STRA|nr:unnamed protein product [Phytophthora fragariaefolia]
MSVALDNSAKISTTLSAIAIDIVQSVVANNDVSKMMRGINRIIFAAGNKTMTSTFRMILLNKNEIIPVNQSPQQPSVSESSSATKLDVYQLQIKPVRGTRIHPVVGRSMEARKQNSESRSNVVINQCDRKDTFHDMVAQPYLLYKDQKRFAVKTARVLYTAEFVLLVRYVEAIVPAIYGV